jgi:putative ABC transport system permease protein
VLDGTPRTVVGIYRTGQEFGDAGSMLPLSTLQASERKPGDLTIAFVRVKPDADLERLRSAVEHDNPELVTVRTASEFGRADRTLRLIEAADDGATVLALSIGVIIVTNAMLLSLVERTREFGVLRAVGWSRRRTMSLIIAESLVMSLAGALLGVALSIGAVMVIEHLPSLRGILDPTYTPGVFGRALYTAVGIGFLGALYPGLRASHLSPLEALRRE